MVLTDTASPFLLHLPVYVVFPRGDSFGCIGKIRVHGPDGGDGGPASAAALGTKPLSGVLAPYADKWDTNWNDHNMVTHAVFAVLGAKPKSAVGVLANGSVALTAFIPNDRAFQILVKQITGKSVVSEHNV